MKNSDFWRKPIFRNEYSQASTNSDPLKQARKTAFELYIHKHHLREYKYHTVTPRPVSHGRLLVYQFIRVRPAYGTTGLLLVSHGKGLVFRVITQE